MSFFYVQILLTFLIGLLVLIKNPKKQVNRSLFLLILFLCLWLVGIEFLNQPLGANPIVGRSIFAAALFMAYFMFLFTDQVVDRRLSKRSSTLILILVLAMLPLIYSPYVLEGAYQYVGSGMTIITTPVRGVAYPLYLLVALSLVASGLGRLFLSYRRLAGLKKAQIGVILFGLFLGIINAVTTNVLLPIFIGSTLSYQFAPLSAGFLSAVLAYAILKQRFLDIRLVVARSVTYILLTLTIGAAFGFTAFALLDQVFSASATSPTQQIAYTTVAVILAFVFQPIKRFFDRVSNRIFFRDAYDTQVVLNKLGGIVVAETNLQNIVTDSRKVLSGALKSAFIEFVVFKKDGSLDRSMMNHFVSIGSIEKLKTQKENIVITEELSVGSRLYAWFTANNVAVSVRLSTRGEEVGYILLGEKQSGDIYSLQDVKLLNIVGSELALAIQNALRFEEIRSFNRTLQDKVDEATIKLRRTNAKLQELDEAKDEFVSMASHQLRTPLTSVKGYLSMALEGDAGELNASQKKLLEEAYASSQRMVYLIGDFLNVSRIKTGKFMLEYAESNLANVIDDEIDQLRATARSRKIDFVYQEPKSFPTIRLDENKVRQVIMNTIDNAIYYSRPGGTITVELFTKDDSVVFRVKDEGIGVPAREQKDLFEKFYRASNARKVRPDGTGIGLFMIKKVILAHGGSIIFNSTENKGSTFGFTLPIKKRIEP